MADKPRSLMTWRRLSDISPYLQHAVILAEDDTFFQHNGFDVEQLKRAMRVNWQRKRMAFGASTLTQQLARTLYLSSHKNILRKAKEALIARRLEKTLTKQRILELYLNVVEWGPNVYGAEAASRHFFGTSAAALTPDQAIALAVILPSPRRWDPHSEKKFIAQRKVILYERMVRANFLPPIEPAVVISSPTSTEMEELPARKKNKRS
jgi:monofunctional biosynthetic peptidoglycan transglycosylase